MIKKINYLHPIQLYILLVFHLTYIGNTSAQVNYFSKCYNPNDTWASCLSIIEKDGEYFGAGVSASPGNGNLQILIIRLNVNGDLQSWKSYGIPPNSYYAGKPGSLIETHDGGYALAGSVSTPVKDLGLLYKFDNNFDTLWSSTFEDTVAPNISFLALAQCKQTFDGGFILVGDIWEDSDLLDVLLIKTDSVGNQEWQKNYGSTWAESGWSVDQTSDGGFIIGGYTYLPGYPESGDPLVIKTDNLGNLQWNKSFGGQFKDGKAAVVSTADNNIIVGLSYATAQPYPDYAKRVIKIVKLTNQGDTLWNKNYGPSRMVNLMNNLRESKTGDLIATGQTNMDTSTFIWGWNLKTTASGDSVWLKYYRKVYNDLSQNRLYDVYDCSDNGYISCGYVFPVNEPPFSQSMWVLKVDSLGNDSSLWVGIDNSINNNPSKLKVYPNPANHLLTIKCCQYPEILEKQVILIYNCLGIIKKEISVQRDTDKYDIDVSGWNSGIYIAVHFINGKLISYGKFIISR